MEKAKNSHNSRRPLLKKMLLSLFLMLVLVLAFAFLLMFINQQTRSGKYVAEIPADLLPTAEYMITHQPPTPEYLVVDFPRATGNRTQIDICILDRYFSDPFHTSRFFVNGSRMPAASIEHSLPSMTRHATFEGLLSDQSSVACISVPHRIGFYFLEFQRSVWLPDPLYQWSIQVVN